MVKHMKNQIKKTMNEVKKKAYADAKKTGKSLLEVNPGDWSDEWWKDAVEYWEGEAHKHRSNVAAQNRKKLKTLHSAGAKSFVELEDVTICSLHLCIYFCAFYVT